MMSNPTTAPLIDDLTIDSGTINLPQLFPVYNLPGPQVEPSACQWTDEPHAVVRMLRVAEVIAITDQPTIGPFIQNRNYFPPYPTDAARLTHERAVLQKLSVLRELPLAQQPPIVTEQDILALQGAVPELAQTLPQVQPLSFFLQGPLRPYQTFDAVYERTPNDEGNTTTHVVTTGKTLARYFEDETPGLAHRLALQYIFEQQRRLAPTRVWSPPRQALVWAALDVALATALTVAWHYKWCSKRPFVSRRPRPIEDSVLKNVSNLVLFDTEVPNNNPDNVPDQDVLRLTPLPSPGTPRHPAYPSGHSTYSAAASTVLARILEAWKPLNNPLLPTELQLWRRWSVAFTTLADNIGMARIWAGVHWPSDHLAGMRLGNYIGNAIYKQIAHVGPPIPSSTIPTIADLNP